jgi:adenine C2-methylase RlmN of 23S rRNA A2503 and tRNA A37
MTLHCLTAVATVTDVSQSDAQPQIHSLLESYDLSLRQEEIEVQERGGTTVSGQDIPEHLYGRYRFDVSQSTKDTLISQLTQELKDHTDVETFEVAYHECDHDEPNAFEFNCTPTIIAESQTKVPDSISL